MLSNRFIKQELKNFFRHPHQFSAASVTTHYVGNIIFSKVIDLNYPNTELLYILATALDNGLATNLEIDLFDFDIFLFAFLTRVSPRNNKKDK